MKRISGVCGRNVIPLPNSPTHVHLMGIGGTGMSALAGLFHSKGFKVSGSDQAVYPPVSDFLNDLGIEIMEGYRGANLSSRPDLVVVGNVIRRTNPEADELEKSGIPFASMPESLNHYFIRDKICLVITGTHGKTTVSAMLAWILYDEDLDPSFMIGGLPRNFLTNYRLGKGRFFILEGDEYDTAYFDKTPKFLHYTPNMGIITSCEYDHADIYDTVENIQDQFLRFVELIPSDGYLIAYGEDPRVSKIAAGSKASLRTYGMNFGADWTVADLIDTQDGVTATILRDDRIVAKGTLPVMGAHNVLNALAAIAAAETVGVEPRRAFRSLQSFKGVARRQQILGEESGILVIDDFAHHPTAVRETCAAMKSRFPDRRVVAVFEPRTNTSRRSIFQKAYIQAFLKADIIVLREPADPEKFPEIDRFKSWMLAADLRSQGKDAHAFKDTEGILDFLCKWIRSGDVVLLMSNGNFDRLGSRLMTSLKEKAE